MSAQAAKAAKAAGQAAKAADRGFLNRGAKRDPELYILMAVMSGAFGLVGYYFGNNPTSATSESKVTVAADSMPWQGKNDASRQSYKYQYHPSGNPKNAPKDAPSALNSVIIPQVNLPKELHEKYNKWGKEGY